MGDSAMTIVAIFVAAILMFVFPLMTMADKNDDVAQLSVQTATTEFTNTVRNTGKLTQDAYDKFVETLAATGNSYDVEMTIQHLDENPAKKSTQGKETIGENVYYTDYTTQIIDTLGNKGSISLKEGDIISVNVKNTNTTIATQLRNFIYKVTGDSSKTITATESGMVTTTAN